jgi:hypothetical protein
MKKSLRARLGDMPDMEDILASGEGSMSMPPEVIEQGRKLVDRGMVRMDANSPLRKKQAEVKMIRRNKVQ